MLEHKKISDDSVNELRDVHWMLDMIQTVDVGIVVFNRQFDIKVWNGFMQAHSGLSPSDIRDMCLFTLFPDISKAWIQTKTRPVFELHTRAFVTWEQRPYVFKFRNYRPITSNAPYMYQNVVFSPLISASGKVENVCMMIYDMTDAACAKKQLLALQVQQNELNERNQT